MRLFIAIKLSPEIEKKLTELQNNMKENGITGNYTNCHNFHLTLAFIGEYDNPDKVMKALNRVSFKPFVLSLEEKTGSFGDIIWIGTKKNPELTLLVERIRKVLDEYRIDYDRKAFKPHITIVRKTIDHGRKKPIINEINIEKTSMTVDSFCLIKSHRIDGKLIYTELECIRTGDR